MRCRKPSTYAEAFDATSFALRISRTRHAISRAVDGAASTVVERQAFGCVRYNGMRTRRALPMCFVFQMFHIARQRITSVRRGPAHWSW